MPAVEQLPYLVLRFTDETQSPAERRVWVRSGTLPAAGLAAGRALGDLVAAASGASFYEVELRYGVKLQPSAGPSGPTPDTESGLLIFSTADPAQYAAIELRGIKPGLINADDNVMLLTDAPPLAALISAIIGGGYVNKFGYALTACIAALHEIRQ